MTRVALVTNWDEHCAVAEYAKNLVDYVRRRYDDKIEFNIIQHITEKVVYENSRDCDVIHFNYCAHAFKDWDQTAWHRLGNIPKMLTFHESSSWQTRRLAKTNIADLYIVHDKIRDGMPKPENVEIIPFGVPIVSLKDVKVDLDYVAMFGCAFPWKQLLPLVYANKKMRFRTKLFLSEPSAEDSRVNWEILKKEILEIDAKAVIEIGWQDQDTLIKKLASCAAVAILFDPAAPINGISASVRYGLAAKRPLILTRFHHFSDLEYDYAGDIYWTENGNLEEVLEILQDDIVCDTVVTPENPAEDMSWYESAKKYATIYQSIKVVEVNGKSLTAG